MPAANGRTTGAGSGCSLKTVYRATARDLLAAAIERFETRSVPIVLHVHDEIVAEVAAGSIAEPDFLAALLEPPAWAEGLPLAGTVWSGTHYFEPPEEPALAPIPPLESVVATLVAVVDPEPGALRHDDDASSIAELDAAAPPLWELTSIALTEDRKTTCPFHARDSTPSLQLYADHFHCFGCGERGDRLDWLMRADGMQREEAIAVIREWDGPPVARPAEEDKASKIARALALWDAGRPIGGTLAARYLAGVRKIDLSALPADIDQVLRFHPRCPFGPAAHHPCLLALMRDAVPMRPRESTASL